MKFYQNFLRFADDSKLCTEVGDKEEVQILQGDLQRMFRKSQDWKMMFNY